MINEYAIEPTLLSNWQNFRYFVEQFGVPKGRLISRYPRTWKRMVYDAIAGLGAIEKKRIEESLIRIDDRLMVRRSTWAPGQSWLDNAEAECVRKPFHAILACTNPNENALVLRGDDVNETNPLWRCSTEIIVPRTAPDMARAIGPLLRISREIILVDPHFDPNASRYRNSLHEFLHVATASRDSAPPTRFEIHTGDRIDARRFEGECRRRLPTLIPNGMGLRLIQWRERPGGEALHNRFVLTDIGGVSFRFGLDEGTAGETDEIGLLEEDVYKTRYEQYAGTSPAFDFVARVEVWNRQLFAFNEKR